MITLTELIAKHKERSSSLKGGNHTSRAAAIALDTIIADLEALVAANTKTQYRIDYRDTPIQEYSKGITWGKVEKAEIELEYLKAGSPYRECKLIERTTISITEATETIIKTDKP